jgi:hypothetical protein
MKKVDTSSQIDLGFSLRRCGVRQLLPIKCTNALLLIAVVVLLPGCAAVNFGLAVSAHQRLTAHAERIIRLEGDLLALTPGGQAMIKANGCPDMVIALSAVPSPPKSYQKQVTGGGVTAYLAPDHVYSGGVLGTLVGDDDEAKLPEHLLKLVRVAPNRDGKVVFSNVPDGVYRLVVQYYTTKKTNVGTTSLVSGAMFMAEGVAVTRGSYGPLKFQETSRNKLLGISDTAKDLEIERNRQLPTNGQQWKNRKYKLDK